MSSPFDDLSLVLDVPVQVTVELGRRTVPIGELIQLGPGAVVELGKAAGESLDLLVNGKLVARGEAVVVGEKYGIRITEVVSDNAGGAANEPTTKKAQVTSDAA
ncbi:MAG: flagellar motor switch protein FliN [Nannocystaceae bacterium]|nr:flagellar motor switch protein FliN [Nannocystaceae bacterium]